MRGEDSFFSDKEGGKDLGLASRSETENNQIVNPDQDEEDTSDVCRVCQCRETDKKGDAALKVLGIYPPVNNFSQMFREKPLTIESNKIGLTNEASGVQKGSRAINCLQCTDSNEKIHIYDSDLEAGICLWHHDPLIELGCLCKNDLALAHYCCALRWFINRGAVICEICGSAPRNVSLADHSKVMAALKEFETLRLRTTTGEVTATCLEPQPNVDPGSVGNARRLTLAEIALWFNPHSHATVGAPATADQITIVSNDEVFLNVNPTTKWVVEGTGMLVATGLLTVTLTWLIAPRVGKETARRGLHILLGGLCALIVVAFLRFGVLPRIRYGPARYWAILLAFWFLVFGVWASSTRGSRPN